MGRPEAVQASAESGQGWGHGSAEARPGWTAQLHRHQARKGKRVPYISHLIAVSGLVWEDGGTEDQAIAGLLHDAIEDAKQSHDSIAQRFGDEVAGIVRDCTDTAEGLTGAVKEPWLVRKTRVMWTPWRTRARAPCG